MLPDIKNSSWKGVYPFPYHFFFVFLLVFNSVYWLRKTCFWILLEQALNQCWCIKCQWGHLDNYAEYIDSVEIWGYGRIRTIPMKEKIHQDFSKCPYRYWKENGKYCNIGTYEFFMKFFFLVPGYKLSVAWRILNDLWSIKHHKLFPVKGSFSWPQETKTMMKTMATDNLVNMIPRYRLCAVCHQLQSHFSSE